jgi:hypothetical protein
MNLSLPGLDAQSSTIFGLTPNLVTDSQQKFNGRFKVRSAG